MSDPGAHAAVGEADERSGREHSGAYVLERRLPAGEALVECDRSTTIPDRADVIQNHENVLQDHQCVLQEVVGSVS